MGLLKVIKTPVGLSGRYSADRRSLAATLAVTIALPTGRTGNPKITKDVY